MIIGKGSASFGLVRDLAVRLPLMVLPKWMDQGSYPIAIDDVVYAIVRALEIDVTASTCFELPGPEWITHRQVLEQAASILGTKMVRRRLPWLSPRGAARLLGFISRERRTVIDELVEGLPSDLTPMGDSLWQYLGESPKRSVVSAMLAALADETNATDPTPAAVERIVQRMSDLQQTES
jgi:hypothetical protein